MLAALGTLLSSCAYYNTYYLAKKYYYRATDGDPYEVDRQGQSQSQNYAKSVDYSKKVLGFYPKSKYVDDAWLLWGKSLIGREDPLQTIAMLQDFPDRFPKSDLRPEAEFYLGLAYRNARKYSLAVDAFDEFLTQAPKHALVPYAHLERARALMSLQRYADAGNAAGQILDHYPKHVLADKARRQRAEARLQEEDFDGARADFHAIGERATNDEERFLYFMREIDCLEAARRYDDELAALRAELAHTPPPPTPTPGQLPPPGVDRYGKIDMRIGTALLLGGHTKEALEEFAHLLKDYPKSALSSEAQFRIGYVYEIGLDDFDRAVQEYARVKDEFGQSPYNVQAQTRTDNLSRIMQYRTGAGADSLEKKGEAAFLTAEIFLFQLNKPDRALEEYAKVVQQYPGTAVAGRALNAQAWVLSRKLNRAAGADSLFWKVVREYPATEAQLAARDYLELEGQRVPESLIVMPKVKPAPAVVDTLPPLSKPPATMPSLGDRGAVSRADSLRYQAGGRFPRFGMPGDSLGMRMPPFAPGSRDSAHSISGYPPGYSPGMIPGRRDTTGQTPGVTDTSRTRGGHRP